MTWNYNDAKIALPAKNGRYEIRHSFMGRFFAYWKGGWYLENGERAPAGLCRWWGGWEGRV